MPRMWMVPPATLCNKHLVAEHHECHVFAGRIKKRMKIEGYLDNNLLEPLSLMDRHNDLADEMVMRGLNHNSMLIIGDLEDLLPPWELEIRIDKDAARAELHSRCPECRERYDNDV